MCNGIDFCNKKLYETHLVHYTNPRKYYHIIVVLDRNLKYKKHSILFKFEKFAAKIDRAISKLEYGDWEKAEILYNKVKLKIEEKI